MIISENIFVMLLEESRFQTFTPKQIPNAHETSQVLIALDSESREEVDAILEKALAAGGTEARPAQDYGFMYGRAYNDLDGHIWEIGWMDMEKFMEMKQ